MSKNNDSSKRSYYDEIFSRIQEMERKHFEEENDKYCNEYLKNYKPSSNNTFNIFGTQYELKRETINS